jgi:hypothetical protein
MGELLSIIKRRLPKPIPIGMFYPELCEEEISAFERRFEVSLPGGYRRFLLELGNGGEGPPAGGIEPLRTGPERPNAAELDGREQSPLMALPFPFTQPWIWDAGTVSDEGSREQADHGSLYLGTDGGRSGVALDYHRAAAGTDLVVLHRRHPTAQPGAQLHPVVTAVAGWGG